MMIWILVKHPMTDITEEDDQIVTEESVMETDAKDDSIDASDVEL